MNAEHGEIYLDFNWKFPLYWLLLAVLEGAVHTTGGEK